MFDPISSCCGDKRCNTSQDYLEIILAFLVVFALWMLVEWFGVMPNHSLASGVTLGLAFALGILASVSTCMATTGGLVVAYGASQSDDIRITHKFLPHILFNLGRLSGYALFGATFGYFGSFLMLSSFANAVLVFALGLVMLIYGLVILKLVPAFQWFGGAFSTRCSQYMQRTLKKPGVLTPLTLGALTFFLPCGFTQALTLYVLTLGDPVQGASILFVFALGTMPVLLTLGWVVSLIHGSVQRYFLKFAGVMVVLLALVTINGSLTLLGSSVTLASIFSPVSDSATESQIQDNVQVVNMTVNGFDYEPHQFIVKKGIPVEWRIDGSNALGCGQVINVPGMGIVQMLDKQTVIRFTPEEAGEIAFNCSMGMMTPGSKFIIQ